VVPALLIVLAVVVAGGVVPGRAGSSPSAVRTTTLATSVSTPLKVHGLLASQTFVVSNIGAADAHLVRVHVRFAAGIAVRQLSTPQGKCVLAPPVAVDCRLGTVRAGAAITLRARYHLDYVPPTTKNDIHAAAGNAAGTGTSGPSYFLDRYWLCGCSTIYTYPNGWTVPATDVGVTVGPDDTVRMQDGYYISPDGVLHFPDGRMIRDTLSSERFIPRKR
jgi:hypothetical protein